MTRAPLQETLRQAAITGAALRVLHLNWPQATDLSPPMLGLATGDDDRLFVQAIRALVDEEPSHPNAWGGLVSKAVSEGFIKPTGEYTAMVSKKSHGRKTAVYVKAA